MSERTKKRTTKRADAQPHTHIAHCMFDATTHIPPTNEHTARAIEAMALAAQKVAESLVESAKALRGAPVYNNSTGLRIGGPDE